MKIFRVVVFLFVALNAYAQDSTKCFRIGATGFIVPKKNFLLIEGEVDKRYNLFSYGVKVGHLRLSQVITNNTFWHYYASAGATIHTVRTKRFSIDPSLHLAFHRGVRSSDASYFIGGGLLGSLRITYAIGNFEFGLKSNTLLTYGQSHFLDVGIKKPGFYFDAFRFGVNLGYKIP